MVSRPVNRGRTERRRAVISGSSRHKPNGHSGLRPEKKQRSQDAGDDLNASDDGVSAADTASSDEEDAPVKKITAFSSLLEAFGTSTQNTDRPRKRQKVSQTEASAAQNTEVAELETEEVDASIPLGNGSDVAEEQDQDSDEEDANALQSDDEEDESQQANPYMNHFSPPEDGSLAQKVKLVTDARWKTSAVTGQTCKITHQRLDGAKAANIPYTTMKDLPLKQRLKEEGESLSLPASEETGLILSAMYGYQDLLYTSRTSDRPFFRDTASLHILNHILTGRDRVLRNSSRLASSTSIDHDDQSLRDQGFTRPKVLVLLETREQCYRWVTFVMRFFAPEQRENWSRFEESFHAESHISPSLPDDYISLFDGNADNDFRLAVKFTRKTVKLFASFYQADLLICSPLGLRRVIAHSDPKKRDSDFLSSIEILALDQTHAMQAQNWAHVTYCIDHLNQQPRDAHGADFNRVKPWYLDGHAQYLRQTIVAGSFLTPEMNALFNSHALNVAGRTKIQPIYDGAIQSLALPAGVKQTFSRFDSSTPSSDPDLRFAYFSSAVLPAITKAASASSSISPAGILLFIPSYLDFVRLRNFFAGSTATENLSFGAVSEYSTVSEARRARSHLSSGKHSVMLYSGRAHHFHRYRFKGLKRIVWYGLPDDEMFYQELVEAVGDTVDEGKGGSADAGIRAVFSRWDGLKLERIVGSLRVRQMITDKAGDTYDFV